MEDKRGRWLAYVWHTLIYNVHLENQKWFVQFKHNCNASRFHGEDSHRMAYVPSRLPSRCSPQMGNFTTPSLTPDLYLLFKFGLGSLSNRGHLQNEGYHLGGSFKRRNQPVKQTRSQISVPMVPWLIMCNDHSRSNTHVAYNLQQADIFEAHGPMQCIN